MSPELRATPVVLTTFTVLADMRERRRRAAVESITKIGAEIHGTSRRPGPARRPSRPDPGQRAGPGGVVRAVRRRPGRAARGAQRRRRRVYISRRLRGPAESARLDVAGAGRSTWTTWWTRSATSTRARRALPRPTARPTRPNCRRCGRAGTGARRAARAAPGAGDLRGRVLLPRPRRRAARGLPLAGERRAAGHPAADHLRPSSSCSGQQVPAVFCESTVSDASMQQVVEATGAEFGGTCTSTRCPTRTARCRPIWT